MCLIGAHGLACEADSHKLVALIIAGPRKIVPCNGLQEAGFAVIAIGTAFG